MRERTLFDLAIDSKLRGCDLVKLKIGDLVSGGNIHNRSTVVQQKTGRPVQFEIMPEIHKSLAAWLDRRRGTIHDFVFPSRIDYLDHLRACLIMGWAAAACVIQARNVDPSEPELDG